MVLDAIFPVERVQQWIASQLTLLAKQTPEEIYSTFRFATFLPIFCRNGTKLKGIAQEYCALKALGPT
jgi:hypothetical protein